MNAQANVSTTPDGTVAQAYVEAGTGHGRKDRLRSVARFHALFSDLDSWHQRPLAERMAVPDDVRAFAAFAAVFAMIPVEADYVVAASTKWGAHLARSEPQGANMFCTQAFSLGFCEREASRMWSKLAQICVITATTTGALTSEQYVSARDEFHAAVTAKRGSTPKSLTAPLFGLNAVKFHRG
jgi:hypothetical protein